MRRQHTRNVLGVCLCLCLAGGGVAVAASAPTALDPDFGGTGLVLTDFTGGEDGANAVAVDYPDNDVVVAGFGDLGDPGRPHVAGFAVAKYLADGTPDPGFSGDGEALVDFGFVNQAATAVAIDSQGRIVVTGTITTFDGSTSSIGVARILPDGTPDPGFGTNGEVVVQPGILSAGYDVAVDDDDRVMVMGAATGAKGFRPMVLRFTSGGELDDSFGDGGMTVFGRVARDSYTSIAIDVLGRIWLGGTSRLPGSDREVAAVRKISADGLLDSGFGHDGIGLPLGRTESVGVDLAVDGPVSVAATCSCGPSGADRIAVGQLNRGGLRSRVFGHNGQTIVGLGHGDARANAISVAPKGRIVVAGSIRIHGETEWALARLKYYNGRLDRGFGDDGTIVAPLGAGVEGVRGVAADGDSRVIAVGLGQGDSSSDFAVARFR